MKDKNFISISKFLVAPVVGVLHHLVFVIEGDTATTYVDGVLDNTRVYAGTLATPAAPINLSIQKKLKDGATALDSRGLPSNLAVNAVRIHAGALTEAQVAGNYTFGPAK